MQIIKSTIGPVVEQVPVPTATFLRNGMENARYKHLRYKAIRYGNLGTKKESTK